MATSVLVTRPAGQGAALLDALAAAGFGPLHHCPLLELVPLQQLAPAQRQQLLDLDRYQHVIFISTNAVRIGMERIDDYWPQLPDGIHWYAIGDATARMLRERGLSPLTPGQKMDSETLLLLPQLQAVADQRVLIVKGEGGRATLRETLAKRGARVDELACYRRRCPQLAAERLPQLLRDEAIEVVLISSGEGLANMLALLSAEETTKFRNIGLVVPSPRVAAMAQQAGFDNVVTAANASDAAMLQALQQWQAGD
ncbi:uroporphyrinogen-III synthase [Seongchinamella sediminis]|uniref:Uroporphyrinogen-III synthase n=1 Tax=Seongchinamella sediminis TaxID=2283635 RepID=A0A3L7DXJ0_9GAMM|nr:uroporphyrinogen-III synthase [Seongchinamella sediminis]RLQ20983.1 uroporphyrinogen-III synthase [Seongchinamella sediminis]